MIAGGGHDVAWASHNPNDLLDWIWVVLVFAVAVVVVAILIGLFVRIVRGALGRGGKS